MKQLLVLVIGALVPISTTVDAIHLSVNYVQEYDLSFVSLECEGYISSGMRGGLSPIYIAQFFKRVPGSEAAIRLTSSGSGAEQVVILDQSALSVTLRFSQTQEGYFSCRTLDGVYQSSEVGLAGMGIGLLSPHIITPHNIYLPT